MDPRDRADALLSRAQARDGYVVTPQNATSPMDAANTQQIARSVVSGADDDPDSTTVVSSSVIEANDHLAEPQPTTPLSTESEPKPTVRLGRKPRPAPVSDVEEEELGGLIPTTKQRSRSNVAKRLDGDS